MTFITTLLIGIEQRITAGIASSLMVFVWRSSKPHTPEVGYLQGEDVFRNVNRYPEARTFSGVLIVRVDASLCFANMAFLKYWLDGAVSGRPGLRHLILDFSAVNDVDAVAIGTLEELATQLRLRGISRHVASMKGPVRDIVARSEWPKKPGTDVSHPSVKHALRRLDLWHELDVAKLPPA